jgi:hypothetical protein
MKKRLLLLLSLISISALLFLNVETCDNIPYLGVISTILLTFWIILFAAFLNTFQTMRDLFIKELDPDDESF